MRNIHLVLLLVCIVFFGCYEDDDESRRTLSIQDAITFENEQNYVVGDTIYVTLNFSRYLDEEGFTNQLDIYESSGSESFRYDFEVQKFSELAGGFQFVPVDSEFLFAEKGVVNEFGGASAVLNEARTTYESRIGLVLAESGRFLLDFQFLNLSSTNFSEDRVQIEIQHFFVDNQPNLEFTVEN